MPDMNMKPLVFLAFANDRDDMVGYLRNLPDEARRLREVLESAEQAGLCEVVVRTNSTAGDIFKVFQDPKYRNRIAILHYGGHANGYQLLLESAAGQSAAADAGGLAKFLGQQEGLQLVFLNGCSTQQQTEGLLEANIPVVISTSRKIDDQVATDFSFQFYQGLAGGASIRTAYREAEAAIQTAKGGTTRGLYFGANDDASNQPEVDRWPWNLYLRDGFDTADQWNLPEAANDPLFGLPPLPERDLPESPYRHLNWFQSEHAEVFFGRGHQIRELYDRLTAPHSAPIVLFYGQSGVGKSSVLDAGLIPRLERDYEVCYRRRAAGGLLATLQSALSPEANDAPIERAWNLKEEQLKKPLIVFLDQVEELYTRPIADVTDELGQLLKVIKATFSDPHHRPQGKLVLSFRKEWLAELESQLDAYAIPRPNKVFLETLDRHGIIEVVRGPARSKRLREHYGLTVEEGVAEIIADDLLEDRGSAIAPTLQILLTKMWAKATEANYEHPQFSQDLYQGLKRDGILLRDFLNQQIAEFRQRYPDAVDSGFLLDLLAQHTTPLGTADQRTFEQLQQQYAHLGATLSAILEQCQDRYLLTVSASTQKESIKTTRLAHDTLAPLVREQFDHSDKPGQRARRILDNRSVDWADNKSGTPLGEADLKVVEQGVVGTRVWNSTEQRLVEASRKLRSSLRRTQKILKVIGALAVAVIATLGAFGWGMFRKVDRTNRALVSKTIEAEKASNEAELNTRIATSRQIATMASSRLETQFEVGMLLAAEAMRTYPSFESRDVLFQAVRAQPALKQLLHPTTVAKDVVFLNDGRLLAMTTGQKDGGVLVWDASGKRLTSDYVVDEGEPSCMAVDQAKKLLAVGFTARYGQTLAGGVVVFDLTTGSRWVGSAADEPPGGAKPRLPPTQDVTSIAFSPDGNTLVAAVRSGGGIVFWDMATRERRVVHPYQQPPQETEASKDEQPSIQSVVYTPDGSQLIAILGSGDPMLLDPNTGRWLNSLNGGISTQKLVVSPDGDRIAMADFDKIVIWSRSQQKQLTEFDVQTDVDYDRRLSINSLAFSHDGKLLAAGLGAETLSNTFPYQHVIGGRGGVTVWDLERQLQLRQDPLEVPGYGVEAVSFSTDGKTLAAASFAAPGASGVVALWNVDAIQKGSARVLFAGEDREHSIECFAFQPRGTFLATGTTKGDVILWESDTLKSLSKPLVAGGQVSDIAFSPDGTRLAAGISVGDWQAPQGGVVVWDVNRRERLTESPLDIPEGKVSHIAFAANGTQLIAAVQTRKDEKDVAAGIIVWNLADWKRVHENPLVVDAGRLTGLAVSPDGSILAAGTVSGESDSQARILLWNAAGQPLPSGSLVVTEGNVSGIVFSPDGKTLATTVFGQGKQGLVLWDVATRGRLTVEPLAVPDAESVFGPAFCEDGTLLACGFGSLEGPAQVVIWDVESRRRFSRMPLVVSHGIVRNVAMMHNTLAARIQPSITVSKGRSHIALLDIDPRAWRKEASRIVNRNLTLAEWQNLFPNQAYRATFAELPIPAYSESFKNIARNLSWTEWRLYYADEPYRRTFAQLPDGPGVAEAIKRIETK